MNFEDKTKEQLVREFEDLQQTNKKLQNKVEEYLQIEEEYEEYKDLLNNTIDIIYIHDLEGKIKYLNKAGEKLFEYITGLDQFNSIFEVISSEEYQNIIQEFKTEITTGAVSRYEFELLAQDNALVYLEVNIRLLNKNNQAHAIHGVARDVSERKRMEKVLLESEVEFNKVFNSGPDPIYIAELKEGYFVEVNDAWIEYTGYSREEALGHSCIDLGLWDIEWLTEMEEQVLAHGDIRNIETVLKIKSGELKTVLFSAELIEIGGEKFLLSVTKDITERTRMEQRLRESEERYRTVFENTGTAMMVIEEDLTMSMVNTEAEKLFGYSRDEVEGKKKWTEFVAPDDLARMKEYHRLRRMDPAGVPTTYEYKSITKQGAVRNISMVIAMIPGTKKSVASHLDITERKEAERKLQEANENLSSSVKELEERNAEMGQLSEMGEQLQSCRNIEEACAISAIYVQKLCPASQGAIYLISSAKDLAEAVTMWGDAASMEKIFMPMDCWSIRRGRPHLIDDSHPGLLCGHITGSQTGQYLCVPMIAHGEAIGILHLSSPAAPDQDQQKSIDILFSEHKTQLALTVADHIAMAINNLRLQEALRQQAIRDILTGLFNRRYMEESLRRELNQAERAGTSVGVIMLDIDHFKNFNDLFGHDGGDALLRELGAFLNIHTRGGDIVSRYGGEEFVAVLPGATLEETRFRAEEMRQGVKELLVYNLGKPLRKCTISLGVAAFPEHGLTSDEILKSADTALYRAKNEGRDRAVVAVAD
jgi:diguanylate cyclase (GGDEF)-like protein/PAS domain S-box-containing protein